MTDEGFSKRRSDYSPILVIFYLKIAGSLSISEKFVELLKNPADYYFKSVTII